MPVSLNEAVMFTGPEFQVHSSSGWPPGKSEQPRASFTTTTGSGWGALEDVLVGLCAVSPDEVTTRTQALVHRPRATNLPPLRAPTGEVARRADGAKLAAYSAQ
jgi:hypothetical protein